MTSSFQVHCIALQLSLLSCRSRFPIWGHATTHVSRAPVWCSAMRVTPSRLVSLPLRSRWVPPHAQLVVVGHEQIFLPCIHVLETTGFGRLTPHHSPLPPFRPHHMHSAHFLNTRGVSGGPWSRYFESVEQLLACRCDVTAANF